MPDIELLKHPSREPKDSLQDKEEWQLVYHIHLCKLKNNTSPFMAKAVCCIQELRNKLENWYKEESNNLYDHFEEGNQNDVWRFDSTNSKIDITPAEFHIESISLQSNYESKTLSPFWKRILLKVLSHIKNLESDLQEAKKELQEEHQKAQRLRTKQNSLFVWKQQQFPVAVQIEYEACTKDITELKWHLEVKKDRMKQLRNSLSHSETQNCQLVKDIDFVRKHDQLVKKKLQLEMAVIKQIKSGHTKTSVMFTKIYHEAISCQQELENKELQMNNERGMMTIMLNDVHNQLKDQINELKRLKSYWDIYCNKVSKTERKAELKDNQLDAILQQISLFKAEETKIYNVIVDLKAKLERQNGELGRKQDGLLNLQNQIKATMYETEAQISKFEEILHRKRQDLICLHDKNKVHEIETKDYNNRISQSKETINGLQSGQKRILQRISQNEEQWEQAKAKLALEIDHHSNTLARLNELNQQTFLQEQMMEKEAEQLKMQLISEMNLVAVFKGSIASITEEMNIAKVDGERMKNELLEKYQVASYSVSQLETRMVELKDVHTAKSKTTDILKKNLSDILTNGKDWSKDLEQQKCVCLDHLNSVKKAHSTFLLRCEQVSLKIEELSLDCVEYRKASDMMEKIAAVMPVEKLQSAYDMVEYKHNMADTMIKSLQSNMVAYRNRIAVSEKAHSTLICERQVNVQEIKSNLKAAQKENMKLEHEYRELQKALMIAKRDAVCLFIEKKRANGSFQDHKQLSLLQRRMHKAMLKYFKHRSSYSQANLACSQTLSNKNNQKNKALQEKFLRTIQTSAISPSLPDDSTSSHNDKADKHGH
ncbi:coiled-coil domain-containing protein 178 isoform X3 [Trichomycterus rosablanca]|uniref:coiled-coil domain-containing protein 178 isoform X3 n=1 Tax=Trichomycterus rosablanca TaxID=2290929 RepID=UPI002F35A8E2